ncbi:hypothetical protein L6R52_24615 [Myxococcota bacterium]|nr:hypothetical protein [Myxococcota bacterium]
MNREKLSHLITRLGGFSGLVAFLAFAVKPAFVYGGMFGVVVASAVAGGPISGPELTTRIFVGLGMVLGVLVTGAVMVGFGALVGALVDAWIVEPLTKRAKTVEPATKNAEKHA